MKIVKILFSLPVCLAFFLTAAAITAVLTCRGMTPVLVSAPEEAAVHAQQLMDAVCTGNFQEAEAMLYGTPSLGADREPSDPIGAMIWEAYVSSLDYELVGQMYATEDGVAQDVKFISLELPTATQNLGRRARELLNEAVEAAKDVSQLYDKNNEYREDLVMDIFKKACRQALEEDVRYTYQIFPLQLVYSDGQWWGVADQTFLNAISGGITE